jgi:Deacetylase PdaC/Protein of unknown function (DUF3298)
VRLYHAIAVIVVCAWAGSGDAAVAVSEQVLQKGQFGKAECTPDPKDPDYNECICDADIRYPQVTGMEDGPFQDKLNDWLKQQAAKAKCEGESVSVTDKSKAAASTHEAFSVHYEVTLSTPRVLGFKFTDWAYTGGAHGNGSVIGVIVDLDRGRILTPGDIFPQKNIAAVNQAIYDALLAKPEEEIFRDQVEARKGAFIKDGACQGCTLTLTPQGLHVLFQTYEVAPYGAGNTDVLVPAQYVGYNSIKEALAAQQQAKPETK